MSEPGPAVRPRRKTDQLVLLVYQADRDLRELAEAMNLSLKQLAALAADEQVARTLGGLRELAEMQSRLIVSRCRVTAAARLVELAGQTDDGELARKASVDLLKLDPLPAEPSPGAMPDGPSAPLDEAKLLAALEKMNRDD